MAYAGARSRFSGLLRSHLAVAQIFFGGELWGFFRRGGFAARRYKSGCSESRVTTPDIPWVIHRIVTSKHYRVSLIEVQLEWAIDDVADAHQALDYFAYVHYVEMKKYSGSR